MVIGPAPESTRPAFSARSVVLSLLLGSHPPSLPTAVLVDVATLFGISPGTTRTALSRMAAKGDIDAGGDGYRLAGSLTDRQRQQDAGRRAATPEWDGRWITVTPRRSARSLADRRDLRRWLERAGFGELRPDYWLRPANVDSLDLRPISVDFDVIITVGEIIVDDVDTLVGVLWPIDDLEATARRHIDESGRLRARLDAAVDGSDDKFDEGRWLVDAFTESADVVRFLMREPRLPPSLVPRPWSPDLLRIEYDDLEAAFQRRLGDFLRRRTQERAAS